MPASRPAHTCGKRWRPSREGLWVLGLALLMTAPALGCDGEEVDREQAKRHAEYHGRYHGETVKLFAQEWTLLHPQSDRQRQAREQRIRLDEMLELDSGEREAIRQEVELNEAQLQPLPERSPEEGEDLEERRER